MEHVKYTNSAQYRCLENLHESFVDLHLVHCGIEHCPPHHTYESPRQEYIIHFVLSGKGSYTVNGITYYLTENQMFLICPGEEILYTADGEDPWVYAWIGINGIRAESSLKKCGLSKQSYVFPFKNQEYLVEQITSILNTSQLTFANDFKRNSHMLMLLAFLMENYNAINQSKKTHKTGYDYGDNIYVEQAITYIKQKHSFGIKVSDVADYVGISRIYLNQIFQKELGISSQKFLMDFRLHKAANLLTSTELSITEVSESIGYDDSLAFSKAFKKKFGLSPKNYRNHKDSIELFHEKQLDTKAYIPKT